MNSHSNHANNANQNSLPDSIKDAADVIESAPIIAYEGIHDRLNDAEGDANGLGQAVILSGWGTRHTQALIVFMGLSMSFVIRLNLALAIVGMENSHRFKITFDPGRKAFAISSFFMGYSLLQIPAGNIGRKGYAVKLFSYANIFSGLLCLFLPYATVTFGAFGIILIRFFTGMLQGFVYPNVNNIMSRWAVPEERDSVMCLVHTGNPFGSLLVLVISGYLDYYFDWPSIFYVTGVMGILFGILMAVTGKDRPEVHKGLSPEEREFISRSFNEEPDEVYLVFMGKLTGCSRWHVAGILEEC